MDAPLVPGRRMLVGQLGLCLCLLVVIALRNWQLHQPPSHSPTAEATTAVLPTDSPVEER